MAARETRLSDHADQIARHFISRYEAEWSNGAGAVSRLYASDAVLVGLVTAIGRSQICELLRGIIGQGWTSIRIKIVNVRQVGGVILIASEYAAIGSGENAGRTLTATSSHVLVESNGTWLATLHTAR
jgi:ketosteroid isomerase-like protein